MPVHEITDQKGKVVGYKCGNMGKEYLISKYGQEGARFRAIKQCHAINTSKEQRGEQTHPVFDD